jgi:isopropylmalate/homocitrate/citramalate synthase
MQEIIEYFINGIVDDNEAMKSILKEFVKLKKERKVNKIAKVEIDEIFRQISGEQNEDF